MLIVSKTHQVITAFIKQEVARQVQFIRAEFDENFKVKTRISFSNKRKRSWGGHKCGDGYISIAAHKYVAPFERNYNGTFVEYDHYANDPEIGSIRNIPWTTRLAACIAHELAHAIQYAVADEHIQAALNNDLEFERGHDEFFQTIYRKLRINLINGKTFTAPTLETEAKPKTKRTTGIRAELKKRPSGWFHHYYYDNATNQLLGIMASHPEGYPMKYDPATKTWDHLYDESGSRIHKMVEARKQFIGR